MLSQGLKYDTSKKPILSFHPSSNSSAPSPRASGRLGAWPAAAAAGLLPTVLPAAAFPSFQASQPATRSCCSLQGGFRAEEPSQRHCQAGGHHVPAARRPSLCCWSCMVTARPCSKRSCAAPPMGNASGRRTNCGSQRQLVMSASPLAVQGSMGFSHDQ